MEEAILAVLLILARSSSSLVRFSESLSAAVMEDATGSPDSKEASAGKDVGKGMRLLTGIRSYEHIALRRLRQGCRWICLDPTPPAPSVSLA